MIRSNTSLSHLAGAQKRNKTFLCGAVSLAYIALIGFFFLAACSKNETAAPKSAESSPTTSPTDNGAANAQYEIGRKISFGQSGDSERFRGPGWSRTEPEITWTDGNSAVLSFSGLPAKTSLRLNMTLSGLTNPPDLPSQPVEVYANGTKVADWQVSDKAEFTALISPNARGDGDRLKLELKIPNATSPKSLGGSEDRRLLGVACFDLVIEKAG